MVCTVCAADASVLDQGGVSGERAGRVLVCARCGAPLAANGATRAGGIVEATAERGPISAVLSLDATDEPTEQTPGASAGIGAGTPGRELVVVRPSLPTLLWRQPAVRAVARAGAGALALTVGMRVLRVWLARARGAPGRWRVAAPAASPVDQLLELAAGGDERPDRTRGRRRGQTRGDGVVETFIYVRRVQRVRRPR